MFDGVGQQLGQRDGQRRREIGGEDAQFAVHHDLDRVQRQHGVFHQQHERADDLVEDHLLARLAREHLVHDGDGANAALGLVQGGSVSISSLRRA